MARMLGRFESRGCCPGTRSGWTRRRHVHGLDCPGAGTDARARKRLEQREFARSLLPEGGLPTPLDDPTDCVHGCNGGCVYGGSERCNFTCHDDLTPYELGIFDGHDRRVMEMLGEDLVEWSESAMPLAAEAAELMGVEWS